MRLPRLPPRPGRPPTPPAVLLVRRDEGGLRGDQRGCRRSAPIPVAFGSCRRRPCGLSRSRLPQPSGRPEPQHLAGRFVVVSHPVLLEHRYRTDPPTPPTNRHPGHQRPLHRPPEDPPETTPQRTPQRRFAHLYPSTPLLRFRSDLLGVRQLAGYQLIRDQPLVSTLYSVQALSA